VDVPAAVPALRGADISALDAGRLSVRRAASLLALSMGELAALLQDYGIEPSFEA
jgi:predicted HTH domain antitoxin